MFSHEKEWMTRKHTYKGWEGERAHDVHLIYSSSFFVLGRLQFRQQQRKQMFAVIDFSSYMKLTGI